MKKNTTLGIVMFIIMLLSALSVNSMQDKKYATVFRALDGHRKTVEIGDKYAFDNGYILEISDGYIEQDSDMLGYSVVSDYQTTLSSSMTTTQSTIAVSSMATTDSHTLTMSDLGSKVFLTIEPTSSSKKEIVMCTGISGSTWTDCTRGLAFYGTSTASVSANRKKHSAGSIIIISNVHYVYEQLVDKDTSETITGDKTYSGNIDFSVNLPTISTATPTTSDQIASKQYVDDVGAGGFTSSNIASGYGLKTFGTSPETIGVATSTQSGLRFDNDGNLQIATSTGSGIYIDTDDTIKIATSTNFTWSGTNKFTGTVSGATKFAGDDSDGVKTVSSSENLDFSSANILIKQYNSLTIDAGQTLGATNTASDGSILWIKVSGNATINGTINMAGKGANGGAGGAGGTSGNRSGKVGTVGTDGYKAVIFGSSAHGGAGGGSVSDADDYYGAGGGGGSHQGIGTNGGNNEAGAGAGTAGAILTAYDEYIDQNLVSIFYSCGSGGGGGGGGSYNTANGGAGGTGGNGGGVIVLEVGGNLTFGASSVLTVAGDNGSDGSAGSGTSNDGGNGGGGSAGQIYILYNGTLTDNGLTKTVSGGTGASGATSGTGGNGGTGDSYITKNLQF